MFYLMKKMSPVASLISVTALLSACAGTQTDNLNSQSSATKTIGNTTVDLNKIPPSIAKAQQYVKITENYYSNKVPKQELEQTIFDSLLIATGIAAVATAFYRSNTDIVGGIGIGGGGIAAYEQYYNPNNKTLIYLKAKQALNCIYNKSQIYSFASYNVAQQTASLQEKGTADASDKTNQISENQHSQALKSTATNLTTTAAIAAGTTKTASPAQSIAVETASDAATSAAAALNAEYAAYVSAPSTIWSAYFSVINYVDNSLVRKPVTLSDVEKQVSDNAAPTSVTSAATARSQLLTALKAQAKANTSTTPAKPADPQVQATADTAAAAANTAKTAQEYLTIATTAAISTQTAANAAPNDATKVAQANDAQTALQAAQTNTATATANANTAQAQAQAAQVATDPDGAAKAAAKNLTDQTQTALGSLSEPLFATVNKSILTCTQNLTSQ